MTRGDRNYIVVIIALCALCIIAFSVIFMPTILSTPKAVEAKYLAPTYGDTGTIYFNDFTTDKDRITAFVTDYYRPDWPRYKFTHGSVGVNVGEIRWNTNY